MDYARAFILVKKYQKLLEPVCDRLLLVGSMRRADDHVMSRGVHDIEFLLIPRAGTATDLFGTPLPDQPNESPLEKLLKAQLESGDLAIPQIARKADGPRFKKFAIPGYNYLDKERREKEFCLELWIVTERTWGIQAVIRTGPAEFSYAFVNSEKYIGFHKASGKRIRGLLPHYYEYIEGQTKIIARASRNPEQPELEQVIDLPTEEAAIKLLGLNEADNFWIEPADRYRYVKTK